MNSKATKCLVVISAFVIGISFEKDNIKKCHLIDLDPWNPEILSYLYPDWNPWYQCHVTRIMHTELKNGALRMLDNTTSECNYRCLYKDGEKNFKGGKWIKLKKNATFYETCDFIETHCRKGITTTFRYIHAQVIRPRQKIFQKEDNLHPGVLRQLYDATTFYFHNKIGRNSRPNAFAIFSGTRITELYTSHFSGKKDSEYPNSCEHGVKMNETVTYDFINQSYASIMAEDWPSMLTWPNCKGFHKAPTDHYGSALVLRPDEEEVKKDFDTHFYEGECHECYHKIMDFLDKFLNEYKGISKFVLLWLTILTHDSASGLYRADKVVVPQYLRSNEQLMLNLKKNSRRHTSHYDIYATLYDIARYARKESFQKWDEHDFSKEFGKIRGGIRARSILRPIQYDRTCEEMEIPDEYCICEKKWYKIDDIRNENVTKAAQFIIDKINDYLKEKHVDEICERLYLKEVVSAESITEQPLLKIVVKASPSEGKYEAQLLKKDDYFQMITRIMRVNRYGNQSHCVQDEDIRPLCYCRQQRQE
ncbi:unnamed protein product [Onchocerca flexuosa]|uniref:DNA-directed DNA polymerase n=1 Tax=Onchocerca flexuosa TaxID=387005 RepID=A0A183GYP3_9BILA|nr:unnamed protein product [Onchocerca flexuosa]